MAGPRPFTIHMYMKCNAKSRRATRHLNRGFALFDNIQTKVIELKLRTPFCDDPCDLAFIYNLKKSPIIRSRLEEKGIDWILVENGFIGDRQKTRSLGYGGLNGRADFLNKNMPSDRWKKFGYEMKPWHSGDYVLLCAQVPNDAALWHYDVDYTNIINDIRAHTDLPIHYRHHPNGKAISGSTPAGTIRASWKHPLAAQLAGARVCVSINSNTGVDAIMAGTPTIALDPGSMVWDLAQHDYSMIENPPIPDREQWGYDMCYAQWTYDEMSSGEAWAHLRSKYDVWC